MNTYNSMWKEQVIRVVLERVYLWELSSQVNLLYVAVVEKHRIWGGLVEIKLGFLKVSWEFWGWEEDMWALSLSLSIYICLNCNSKAVTDWWLYHEPHVLITCQLIIYFKIISLLPISKLFPYITIVFVTLEIKIFIT